MTTAKNQPDLTKTRRQKPAPVEVSDSLDRLPPHSIEAEQGVLACQLNSIVLVSSVVEALKNDVGAFYDLRHQTIQEAIIALAPKCDLITLQQHLKDKNLLEQVGGIDYLSRLPDMTPSAANLPYYLEILQEKYRARKLLQLCARTTSLVRENESALTEVLDEFEKQALQIRNANSTEKKIQALACQTLDYIEFRMQNKGQLSGLSTGFPDLDWYTDGFQKEYIVIGGPSSFGKTSLALNIADHIAIELGKSVGFFSLEMSAESLTNRLVFTRARLSFHDVRAGNISENDFPRMQSALEKIRKSSFHIDDTKGLTIAELKARARRMKQTHGLEIIFIDYIQKLSDPEKLRRGNREQEISSISQELCNLSGELSIPVVALSQLNKEGEMRESAAIFNDADLLLKLQKKEGEEDKDEGELPVVELLVEKQRNGPTGKIELLYYKRFTKFENKAKQIDTEP